MRMLRRIRAWFGHKVGQLITVLIVVVLVIVIVKFTNVLGFLWGIISSDMGVQP